MINKCGEPDPGGRPFRQDPASSSAADKLHCGLERAFLSRSTPSASRSSLEAKHHLTKPSPSGPNATPGARPSCASTTSFLQNARLSFIPSTRKNAYIAPDGVAACTPRNRVQLRNQEIAGAPVAFHRARDHRLSRLHRRQSRALNEHRHARGVVLDQLADLDRELGRRNEPADPPPGHQPRLGERVGGDEPVALLRDVEERRRGGAFAEPHPVVGIVGDDPDAEPAAVLEDLPAAPRG